MNIREWSLPSYAPPRLSDDTTLNSTWHTGWVVLYLDVSSEVLLVHMGTAAVREAPWISLRTPDGVVFFANLVSRETRWIPPRRWMQGWKRRREAMYPELLNADVHPYSHLDASRAADPRISPIPSYTRRMVEGGAPYMHEDGIPQYPPDVTDSEDTYPPSSTILPRLQSEEPCSPKSWFGGSASDVCVTPRFQAGGQAAQQRAARSQARTRRRTSGGGSARRRSSASSRRSWPTSSTGAAAAGASAEQQQRATTSNRRRAAA